MTQTTLYSDKNLFLSLYKSALRRLKGIGAIYFMLSFITFPVFFVMSAFEAKERLLRGDSYYGFAGNPEMYPTMSMIFYFALVAAGAVLMSVYINNFMHSKKAVDVFHALPIKRSQQLVANFAAVVTVLLLSQFVCYGFVMIINELTIQQLAWAMVGETFRVAICTVVIVAISFLCSVCCNASLDAVIFTGAFMAIVPAYTALYGLMMDAFVYGFHMRRGLMYGTLKFSPVAMLWQTFCDPDDLTWSIFYTVGYIAVAVAVVFLACKIYTRRKSEMAQSASTKSPLYQFVLLAASTGGGAFIGILYKEIFGYSTDGSIGTIVICAAFTVAVYLVFNGVITRNPKPNKRGLMGLAASLVITVGFLTAADNGFFGYEAYIPETEKIEHVSVNYVGDYSQISEAFISSYQERIQGDYSANSKVIFTDKEEIEKVKEIHKEIADSADRTGMEVEYYNIYFVYTLDNGREVYRSYRDEVPLTAIDKLTELEDLDSFKKQLYPIFRVGVDAVESFSIKTGFGRDPMTLDYLSDEQKEKLYKAIGQDTLNITRQMKDSRQGVSLAKISINYVDDPDTVRKYIKAFEKNKTSFVLEEVTVEAAVYDTVSISSNYSYVQSAVPLFNNVVFDVTEDCINTIKVLNELGLEDYTIFEIPQNLKASVVSLSYPIAESRQTPIYNANHEYNQFNFADSIRWERENRSGEYVDDEQLKELVAISRNSIKASNQESSFAAVMFTDEESDMSKGELNEFWFSCYYIDCNDIPDFVKKDIFKDGNYHNDYGYIK